MDLSSAIGCAHTLYIQHFCVFHQETVRCRPTPTITMLLCPHLEIPGPTVGRLPETALHHHRSPQAALPLPPSPQSPSAMAGTLGELRRDKEHHAGKKNITKSLIAHTPIPCSLRHTSIPSFLDQLLLLAVWFDTDLSRWENTSRYCHLGRGSSILSVLLRFILCQIVRSSLVVPHSYFISWSTALKAKSWCRLVHM